MKDAGAYIHIDPGLRPSLSEEALIEDGFIAQRVKPGDLDVRPREVLVRIQERGEIGVAGRDLEAF
jgi:hypothetical protein